MATNTYDEFRVERSTRRAWASCRAGPELDDSAQEQAFRVLRRLAVARALDGGDAFSVIEVEAGLGEDAASADFSAVDGAAHGRRRTRVPRTAENAIGAMLETRMPESALAVAAGRLLDLPRRVDRRLDTICTRVRTGFDRQDDEDFVRLTAARKRMGRSGTVHSGRLGGGSRGSADGVVRPRHPAGGGVAAQDFR